MIGHVRGLCALVVESGSGLGKVTITFELLWILHFYDYLTRENG
jgi:hypothetical protein